MPALGMSGAKFHDVFWGAETTSVFDLKREDVLHLVGHVIADAMSAIEIHNVRAIRLEVTEAHVKAYPERPIPGVDSVTLPLPVGMARALIDLEAGPPRAIPPTPLTLTDRERTTWEGLEPILDGASRIEGCVYLTPYDFAVLRKVAGHRFSPETEMTKLKAGEFGVLCDDPSGRPSRLIRVSRQVPRGFAYIPPEPEPELIPPQEGPCPTHKFNKEHLYQIGPTSV